MGWRTKGCLGGRIARSGAAPAQLCEKYDVGPQYPAKVAKRLEGYKTNKRLEYPLADEYTLDGKTPLDGTGVEHLTEALQRKDRKRKRLTGPTKWEEKLQIPGDTWAHLAKLYTSPMVTARDMHLHFKHITHHTQASGHVQPLSGQSQHVPHMWGNRRILDTPR